MKTIHILGSDKERTLRNGDKDKTTSKFNLSLDQSNTYQLSMSRRYINIEDISQIKNDNFYYKLVEKLFENVEDNKEKENICHECGCMHPCKLRSRYEEEESRDDLNKDNRFFQINDTYVWLDLKKLDADLVFLSNILDTVHVLGYIINPSSKQEFKILKAIAIYIE